MFSFPSSHSRSAISTIAAVLLLLAGSLLSAQTHAASGSATINGIVRDAHQKPVSAALVTLQSGSQTAQTTHTDAKGKYEFAALPAGSYSLRAEGSALATANGSQITLADSETKQLDLVLAAPVSSTKNAEFYEKPTFIVAGVSESSGAGVHGSTTTVRNADSLAKSTATLAQGSNLAQESPVADPAATAQRLRKEIATNDQAELHNRLGHAEEELGHAFEALQSFQRAAEMDPSESNLFDWGVELLVHRTAEPAAEVFARGTRLYPNSTRMLTALGVAEYARGSYESAVECLCEASDLDPRDPNPYIFLGKMQNAEVKRSPNTLAKLARFAELYPNSAEANYYYAVALSNQQNGSGDAGNSARAERFLQKAIALDPKMALAYLQLGTLYESREQFPEAATVFEQAVALDQSLEEAHYRLAQLYRRTGDDARAQRELKAYKRAADSTSEAAEHDRKQVQQFVYRLKTPASPPAAR
jgi:tetratricopeptide (TPR) repeat protein